jgi:hypothetical protein
MLDHGLPARLSGHISRPLPPGREVFLWNTFGAERVDRPATGPYSLVPSYWSCLGPASLNWVAFKVISNNSARRVAL